MKSWSQVVKKSESTLSTNNSSNSAAVDRGASQLQNNVFPSLQDAKNLKVIPRSATVSQPINTTTETATTAVQDDPKAAMQVNDLSSDTTTCSNVGTAQIRHKYRTLLDWINDPVNIYIGRKGIINLGNGRTMERKASIWGNPFKEQHGTLQQRLVLYEEHVRKMIAEEHLENELESLRNHNLGCWCVPRTISIQENVDKSEEVCHGQVLMRILRETSTASSASSSSSAVGRGSNSQPQCVPCVSSNSNKQNKNKQNK